MNCTLPMAVVSKVGCVHHRGCAMKSMGMWEENTRPSVVDVCNLQIDKLYTYIGSVCSDIFLMMVCVIKSVWRPLVYETFPRTRETKEEKKKK